MAHAFISHSSQDKAAADAVCAAMEAAGISCWIAPRDVPPGVSYAGEIVQAIGGSRLLVLLHSKASNESPQVLKEVERADAKRIPIISVRIEGCQLSHSLEYFLSAVQWLDATTPPLESHLPALVEAARTLLGRAEDSAPAQPVTTTETSPGPRRPSRSGFFAAGAALLTAVVATGGWWLAHRGVHPTAPDASAREAGGPAPSHGVPITAHPPPKTSNPEAAAAYAAALQNLRDASAVLTLSQLRQAVKLDPTLAAANLRLCLIDPANRDAFAAASQFRAALDDRDTALLSVAEAMTADPPDMDGATARIRAVVARYPDDAEVACFSGMVFNKASQPGEARAAYARALELDPQFAMALWGEASTSWSEEDIDGASAAFRRCLQVSPMAASCLRNTIRMHDERGECEEAEKESRRLVSIEPAGSHAHWFLAKALAARGAPVESVQAALDKAATLGGLGRGALPSQPLADAALALLTGDLIRAEAAGQAMEKGVAGNSSEKIHSDVTELLMSIAAERGDTVAQRRLADEFYRRAPAWASNDPGGVRLWRLYLLHEQGSLADAPFQEQREQLYREAIALTPTLASKELNDEMQSRFYAERAETAGEAADALARFATEHVPVRYGLNAGAVGKVYLLAGKLDAAIPLLRIAANSCSILPSAWDDIAAPNTIIWLRANLLLGEALAKSGDKAGACAAYGKILARWDHPVPRSVTVDATRAGMKTLRCEK